MRTLTERWQEWCICLGLFSLSLLTRAISPAVFITWDELKWVDRSAKFLGALTRGDFAATALAGHPGITTMWIGSLAISLTNMLHPTLKAGDWLVSSPSLDPYNAAAMKTLDAYLPAAQVAIAIVLSLTLVGIYVLSRRLFGHSIASLGTLLLVFEPFHIALSRVLHVDALAASFMALSALASLCYLRPPHSRSDMLFAGAMAGLAVLTKTPAAFLIVFVGLTAFVFQREKMAWRERALFVLQGWGTWGLAAALVFILLFPAMWTSPATALTMVLGTASHHASTPHLAGFFMGKQVDTDPGIFFYPIALLFRLSPLTLLGVILSPLYLAKQKEQRWVVSALLIYILLFVLIMTLGAKKFDRYLTPIFPALAMLSGIGWGAAGQWVKKMAHLPNAIMVLALIGTQALLALPLHPYYLAYYNPLVGGLPEARWVLPVGWGEGIDQAVAYLNALPNATETSVATAAVVSVAPRFVGKTLPLDEAGLVNADYVLFYISDEQTHSPLLEAFKESEVTPFTVQLFGTEYVWVYPNIVGQEALSLLQEQTTASDLILLGAPSRIVRHYQGPAALYTVPSADENALAQILNLWTENRKRIWLIDYGNTTLLRLLDTHALLLEEHVFLHTRLRLYQLREGAVFQPLLADRHAEIAFGDHLRLEAYGLSATSAEYRQSLGVALRWHSDGALDGDYNVFLHLVDEAGRKWAQVDAPILDTNGNPSSAWVLGTQAEGTYTLALMPGVPPGKYRLVLGVYRPADNHRLNVFTTGGTGTGTAWLVGEIKVRPATVPATLEELAPPNAMHEMIGPELALVGHTLAGAHAIAGQKLTVWLYWEAQERPSTDYKIRLTLRDQDGQILGQSLWPVAGLEYPTTSWPQGERLRVPYRLPVAPNASPGEGTLFINLQRGDGTMVLREDLSLLNVPVEPRQYLFQMPPIQHPISAQLGESITFLGYDLATSSVKSGEVLEVTLYWKALADIGEDYKGFVHLLDTTGILRAQRDTVPQNGARPTSGWIAGEIVVDHYALPIGVDVVPGVYTLEVGLYNEATGMRLPVQVGGSDIPERRILLGTVEIQP
ncbi:MAG: glycosyltransferase family 39 protein [Chloroflexi bacterium]|nr:glycosyltransferase family 39 protein [Chloroflexota bacterium]